MKRIVCILLLAALSFCLLAGCENPQSNADYLRIHVRANSNEADDQEIKLVVRDCVIGYLTPLLKDTKSVKSAEKVITSHTPSLEKMCSDALSRGGFPYNAKVKIRTEEFPEKSYGTLILEEGFYRAVVIELGEAKGDNWWCVAFPPLCFEAGEDYENAQYKSLVYEIIKEWTKNGKD